MGPKSLIPCLEGVAKDRDQNFHGKQKMMKVEVMGLANKKKHELPNHFDI